MFKNARLLILFVLCSVLATGQRDGAISGVVLDEHGDPLAGAQVHVQRNDQGGQRRPVTSIFETALTDSNGRFIYGHLESGSYDIYAMKERDGYPNKSNFLFFQDGIQPIKATLSPAALSAEVTVPMGPKAGRIALVRVADAATGKPITVTDPTSGKLLQIPYVKFTRNDVKTASGGPITFSNGSGVLTNLLVPADIPVTIKVGAPGYADWYYPGTPDPAKAQPVRLRSGEELSFDALLQPLPE